MVLDDLVALVVGIALIGDWAFAAWSWRTDFDWLSRRTETWPRWVAPLLLFAWAVATLLLMLTLVSYVSPPARVILP
jgi:hypothetical protein